MFETIFGDLEDEDDLQREFLENRLLDWVEIEYDRRGLDGWRIADILSYYIANDPRFRRRLELEIRRIAIASTINIRRP